MAQSKSTASMILTKLLAWGGASAIVLGGGALMAVPAFATGADGHTTGNPELPNLYLTLEDGSPSFDSASYNPTTGENPGQDSATDNGIVRINDPMPLKIDYKTGGRALPNLRFVMTLPKGVQMDTLPRDCETGSTLNPKVVLPAENPITSNSLEKLEQQVVTCIARNKNQANTTAGFNFGTIRARTEAINGTKLEDIKIQAVWDGQKIPAESNSYAVTTTAKLAWELDTALGAGSTEAMGRVRCPWDNNLWCYAQPSRVLLRASNGGKAVEALEGPISFTLDLSPDSVYDPQMKGKGWDGTTRPLSEDIKLAQKALEADPSNTKAQQFLKDYAPRMYKGPGEAPATGSDYAKKYYLNPGYGIGNLDYHGSVHSNYELTGNSSSVFDSGVYTSGGNMGSLTPDQDGIPTLGKIPVTITGADTSLAHTPTNLVNSTNYYVKTGAYASVGSYLIYYPEKILTNYPINSGSSKKIETTIVAGDLEAKGISGRDNPSEILQAEQCWNHMHELFDKKISVADLKYYVTFNRFPAGVPAAVQNNVKSYRDDILNCGYILEKNTRIGTVNVPLPAPRSNKVFTGLQTLTLPANRGNNTPMAPGQLISSTLSATSPGGLSATNSTSMMCDVWDGTYLDLAQVKLKSLTDTRFNFGTQNEDNPGVWISGTNVSNPFGMPPATAGKTGTEARFEYFKKLGYFTGGDADNPKVNEKAYQVWYANIPQANSKAYPQDATTVGETKDQPGRGPGDTFTPEHMAGFVENFTRANTSQSRNKVPALCRDADWKNSPEEVEAEVSASGGDGGIKTAEDGTKYYPNVNAVMIYQRLPKSQDYGNATAPATELRTHIAQRISDNAPVGKVISNAMTQSYAFSTQNATSVDNTTEDPKADSKYISAEVYKNHLTDPTTKFDVEAGKNVAPKTWDDIDIYSGWTYNPFVPAVDWDNFASPTNHNPVRSGFQNYAQGVIGKATSAISKTVYTYRDNRERFPGTTDATRPDMRGLEKMVFRLSPKVSAATVNTYQPTIEDCMAPEFNFLGMQAGSPQPNYVGVRPTDGTAQLPCPDSHTYLRWKIPLKSDGKSGTINYEAQIDRGALSTPPESPYWNIAGIRLPNETLAYKTEELPAEFPNLDKYNSASNTSRVMRMGIKVGAIKLTSLSKSVITSFPEANRSSKDIVDQATGVPGSSAKPAAPREIEFRATVTNMNPDASASAEELKNPFIIDVLPTKAQGEEGDNNRIRLSGLRKIVAPVHVGTDDKIKFYVTKAPVKIIQTEGENSADAGRLDPSVGDVTWCEFTGHDGDEVHFTNGNITNAKPWKTQSANDFTAPAATLTDACPATTAEVKGVMAMYAGGLKVNETFSAGISMIPSKNDGSHSEYVNEVGAANMLDNGRGGSSSMTPAKAGVSVNFATLGNQVFDDLNRNGVFDTGDKGMPGVQVKVCGIDTTGVKYSDTARSTAENPVVSCQSAITDAKGEYEVKNLTSGTYRAYFAIPTDYEITTRGSGAQANHDNDSDGIKTTTPPTDLAAAGDGKYWVSTNEFTIDPVSRRLNIDLGLLSAKVGDLVFADANGDGIQDEGEAPLPGWKVELYQGAVLKDTTTTDAKGHYRFEALKAGEYELRYFRPAGSNTWAVSPKGSAADQSEHDSDGLAAPAGKTYLASTTFTLKPGENRTDIDQGFVPLYRLGDTIWVDQNRNGIQDEDLGKIPDMKITLTGTTSSGMDIGSWQQKYGHPTAGAEVTPGATATGPTAPVGGKIVVGNTGNTYRLPLIPNGNYSLRFEFKTDDPNQWNWTKTKVGDTTKWSVVSATADSKSTHLIGQATNIAVLGSDVLNQDAGISRGKLVLEIKKTTTVGSLSPKGGTVGWQFVVTNPAGESSADAWGVSIDDPSLPGGAVLAEGGCKDGCTPVAAAAGAPITKVNLKPGASAIFSASQTVSGADVNTAFAATGENRGFLVNTAYAVAENCKKNATDPLDCKAPQDTARIPILKVGVEKEVAEKYYGDENQDLHYTFTVTNDSPVSIIPNLKDTLLAANVVTKDGKVNDPIPAGASRTYTGTYTTQKADLGKDNVSGKAILGAEIADCAEGKICQDVEAQSNPVTTPLAAVEFIADPLVCGYFDQDGKASNVPFNLKVKRLGTYQGELRGTLVAQGEAKEYIPVNFVLPKDAVETEVIEGTREGTVADLKLDAINGRGTTKDVKGVEGSGQLPVKDAISNTFSANRAMLSTNIIPVKEVLAEGETKVGAWISLNNDGHVPLTVSSITSAGREFTNLYENPAIGSSTKCGVLTDEDRAKGFVQGYTPLVGERCIEYKDLIKGVTIAVGEKLVVPGPNIVVGEEGLEKILQRSIQTTTHTSCIGDNPITGEDFGKNQVTGKNYQPVTFTVASNVSLGQSGLGLSKAATNQTYQKAGDKITYTFTVTNTGSVKLKDVSIVDPKLTGTSQPTLSADSNCVAADDPEKPTECVGVAGDTEVDLDVGATAKFTGVYTVKDTDMSDAGKDSVARGWIHNEAHASGKVAKDGGANVTSKPSTAKVPRTSYTLEKTASHLIIRDPKLTDRPNIFFSFTLTNTGQTPLNNIVLTDPWLTDKGVTLPVITADLEPGQSKTYSTSFDYTSEKGKTWYFDTLRKADPKDRVLKNEASLKADPPAGFKIPGYTPLTVKDAIDPVPLTELAIEKTALSQYYAGAKDRLAYLFKVTNIGGQNVREVYVSDKAIDNDKACYITAGTEKPTDEAVKAKLGEACAQDTLETLEPDQVAWFLGWHTVSAEELTTGSSTHPELDLDEDGNIEGAVEAGKIKNAATAHGKVEGAIIGGGGVMGGTHQINLDTLSNLSEVPLAQLNIVKNNESKSFTKVGDKLNYSFTVSNTGVKAVNNVEVTDKLLTGGKASFKECVEKCTNAGGKVSLEPGGSAVFTGSYQAVAADVEAGKVENQASVQGVPDGATSVFNPETGEKGNVVEATSNKVHTNRLEAKESLHVNRLNTIRDADSFNYQLVTHNTGNAPIKITSPAEIEIKIWPTNPGATTPLCTVSAKATAPETEIRAGDAAVSNLKITPKEILELGDCKDKVKFEDVGRITAGVKTGSKVVVSLPEGETDKQEKSLGLPETGKPGSAETPVTVPRVALTLKKTAATPTYQHVGDKITWRFEITNIGGSQMRGPGIVDAMLGGDAATVSQCKDNACNTAEMLSNEQRVAFKLDPGNTAYFQGESTVNEEQSNSLQITNLARSSVQAAGSALPGDAKWPGHEEEISLGEGKVLKLAEGMGGEPLATASARVSRTGLHMTKTVSPQHITQVGEMLTYTMTVENIGALDADLIKLMDYMFVDKDRNPMPGTTITSVCDGECKLIDEDADGVNERVILKPGGRIIYTGTKPVTEADMEKGLKVENTAWAEAVICKDETNLAGTTEEFGNKKCEKVGDPIQSNEAKVVTHSVSMTLDKNAVSQARVGDEIVYTFSVKNTGSASLADISISDANVDSGTLRFVSRDDETGDAKTREPNNLFPLKPGGTVVYQAKRKVLDSDKTAGSTTALAPNGQLAAPDQVPGKINNVAKVSAKPVVEGGIDDATGGPLPGGPGVVGGIPVPDETPFSAVSGLTVTEVHDRPPATSNPDDEDYTPGTGTPGTPGSPGTPGTPGVPGIPNQPTPPGTPSGPGQAIPWVPGGVNTPHSPTEPTKWLIKGQQVIGYPKTASGPALGVSKFSSPDPVSGNHNTGGGLLLRAADKAGNSNPVAVHGAIWNAGYTNLQGVKIQDTLQYGPELTGMRATLPDGTVRHFVDGALDLGADFVLEPGQIIRVDATLPPLGPREGHKDVLSARALVAGSQSEMVGADPWIASGKVAHQVLAKTGSSAGQIAAFGLLLLTGGAILLWWAQGRLAFAALLASKRKDGSRRGGLRRAGMWRAGLWTGRKTRSETRSEKAGYRHAKPRQKN